MNGKLFLDSNISWCIATAPQTFANKTLPAICHPITTYEIKNACKITDKYGFTYFDSLIVSCALELNCSILHSEDLQHNQIIEGKLKIVNPFL
jgi:predicted nucleic acid-binding protein